MRDDPSDSRKTNKQPKEEEEEKKSVSFPSRALVADIRNR
jgi:hypothetical protein